MKLTSDIQSDDIIFEADGQKVLTDELTLDMIKGIFTSNPNPNPNPLLCPCQPCLITLLLYQRFQLTKSIGSKLDWVEEMIEQSFQIVDNPNAESSCGCKVSFNIKAPPSSG